MLIRQIQTQIGQGTAVQSLQLPTRGVAPLPGSEHREQAAQTAATLRRPGG